MTAVRKAAWLRGLAAMALLALAGALTGAGHLDPRAWLLAWLGVAITAAALTWRVGTGWLAAGLILGGFTMHWTALPWHFDGLSRLFPGGVADTWRYMIPYTLAWTLPQRGPILLAWLVGRRWRLPLWVTIPVGWWAGEALWDATVGLSHDAWLYSQWQVAPVLRAAGHLGWDAALLLAMAIAVAAGEAAARRTSRPAVVAALGVLALLALPPLPPGDPKAFDGVGAVQMTAFERPPRAAPAGVTLLLWPELARNRVPRLAEGPGRGKRVELPFAGDGVTHLLGGRTRMAAGLHNAIVAAGPDGRVIHTRAKTRLFPLTERPLAGLTLPSIVPYVPGTASPLMPVAGRRLTGLVCMEELDRGLVAWGRREGADLVVLSSNDWIMGDSELGHRQVVATAVFRAVEARAPLVRSSIFGLAAFVSADGRLLRVGRLGQEGVLTMRDSMP